MAGSLDIVLVMGNIKFAQTNSRTPTMSSLEKRAWLSLCSMCPPYLVYFVIQSAFPQLVSNMLDRIICLAAVATVHALVYLGGFLLLKRRERGEPLLEDERDQAIDGRATRSAYFALITGVIVVGVVMPFDRSGWQIVNAALLVIVLAEAMRHALIVSGYRRPRLAH